MSIDNRHRSDRQTSDLTLTSAAAKGAEVAPPLRVRALGTIPPENAEHAKLAPFTVAVRASLPEMEMTGKAALATSADRTSSAAGPLRADADRVELDDGDDDFEDELDGVSDEGEVGEDGVPTVSRKVRRRRRRERPRSKTIAMKRLTREELRIGALMFPPVEDPRPSSRAECKSDVRPCPWVACKHHLYLDINPETGSIKINFPDLEPWDLKETCALDVAERGGITLEEVGEIMNLTRERIRQVEVRGLLRLKMGSPTPDELGADLLREAAEKKR